ncbi:uncharacterized protein LOC108739003 [Agrilus planipennis]|uniref:Uncharacterized protein LOC108739003 n=1 Tax=Agrilus planipennis TaxID=224129 RepID=A0A1W4X6Z0_AGRPL|nr:uncharacterized protein LOC108739003 [Agrilus planipennis]
MPPATKRDVAVIVFDIDRSNKEFYEKSLNFLFDISSREWFFSPKNSVQLLLLNSNESKNCLQKPNILEVFKHFIQFSPTIIKEDIEKAKYVANKATWIDAITVGLKILSNEIDTQAGIVSAQLVLISKNYSNISSAHTKDIKAAIKTQNKCNIKTIIVGLSVSVGFIRDMHELNVWAKNPIILDEINEESKHALETMCKDSETLICDLKLGRDLFVAFRTKTKMYPWNALLSIGTSLEIPTSMYHLLKGEGAVSVQPPRNLNPNYFTWVYAEDETRKVAHDNVVHGVLRWNKVVAFEDNLKKYFKVEGPKNFTLRGFTEKKNIPESIFLEDGTSVLAPNFNDPHSHKLLYLFYKCLLETDKVGIASKVYARNNQPRLVALIPDENHQTILVNQLPYADDVIATCTVEAPEKNESVNEEQTEEEKEVFEFVNSLMVPVEDFHLSPQLSVNPRSAQMAIKIAKKFLGICESENENLKLPSSKGSAFETRFPVVKETKEGERGEAEAQADTNEDREEIYDDNLL